MQCLWRLVKAKNWKICKFLVSREDELRGMFVHSLASAVLKTLASESLGDTLWLVSLFVGEEPCFSARTSTGGSSLKARNLAYLKLLHDRLSDYVEGIIFSPNVGRTEFPLGGQTDWQV